MWKSIRDLVESTYWGRLLLWEISHKNMLPLRIEIETFSKCNRSCSYCPVSVHLKDEVKLSFEVFKKLVDELSELNWAGEFSPHFYSEPFLDERLPMFLEYLKLKIPSCRVIIYTNADLLTEAIIKEYFCKGYVDKIVVSNHNITPSIIFLELQKYVVNSEFASKIVITQFHDHSYPKQNRGGVIKISNADKIHWNISFKKGCIWHQYLVISAVGNILMCCNDYFEKYPYANIYNISLKEAWRKSKNIRKEIWLGRYSLDICKKCTGLID